MRTLRSLLKALLLAAAVGALLALTGIIVTYGMFEDERWFLALLLLGFAAVGAAAWYSCQVPEPQPVTPLLARGVATVPVTMAGQPAALEGTIVLPTIDRRCRLITPGARADLWDPYEEARYFDGLGDE